MRLTLNTKVTAFVSLAVLVIGIASTAFFVRAYRRDMVKVTTARGTTMAEALSRGVAQGIAEENLGIIQQVRSIVHANDVLLAQVYSSLWLPIDSYPDDNFRIPPDPEAQAQFKAQAAECIIRHQGSIDFYAPVFYNHLERPREGKYVIGYVRIRLSTRAIAAGMLRGVLGYFGGALLIALAASVLLHYLLRKLLIKPIERLNQAVSTAVGSEAFTPVLVSSSDEIGELSGNFNRMLAAIQERESRLRTSQELFSTAFRVSPDAMAITRLLDGRYLEVNEGLVAETGFPAAEIVGRTANELGLWVDPAERERLVQALAAHGAVTNMEMAIRRKDGSLRTGDMSARMVEIGGEPCILSITRDITEREQVRRQLQEMDKLEALGVMAGGIAHDFNNLLTAILGNISLAASFLETGHRSTQILAKAESAGKRAAELSLRLLTFARGGAPVKKPSSMRRILEESMSLALTGAKVGCVLDFPPGLPAVDVDPGQIAQVVHNLIINAIQAMPDGGGITISGARASVAAGAPCAPGDYIRVSITDTGCGISEETQKRIFDPFFTTKRGGSGLGLATSHSIVQRHGGVISVRSAEGEGTTFEILLPVSREEAAREETDSLGPAADLPGRSILVMDDEQTIRDMLTGVLHQLGCRVQACTRGEEAVALHRAALEAGDPYAVAIMDLTIPGGMGGAEAARQILARDPGAQLVVSSGYSNDPVMAQFASHGFRACLMKPYSLVEVTRILHELARVG
jgi:PAS domain S-box-containing protein